MNKTFHAPDLWLMNLSPRKNFRAIFLFILLAARLGAAPVSPQPFRLPAPEGADCPVLLAQRAGGQDGLPSWQRGVALLLVGTVLYFLYQGIFHPEPIG